MDRRVVRESKEALRTAEEHLAWLRSHERSTIAKMVIPAWLGVAFYATFAAQDIYIAWANDLPCGRSYSDVFLLKGLPALVVFGTLQLYHAVVLNGRLTSIDQMAKAEDRVRALQSYVSFYLAYLTEDELGNVEYRLNWSDPLIVEKRVKVSATAVGADQENRSVRWQKMHRVDIEDNLVPFPINAGERLFQWAAEKEKANLRLRYKLKFVVYLLLTIALVIIPPVFTCYL